MKIEIRILKNLFVVLFLVTGLANVPVKAEIAQSGIAGNDNTETIESDCEAGFTYLEVSTGLVMFVNMSSPPDQLEYSWDFGDGQTSTEMNPFHAYEEAGTYEVCLSIYDSIFQCEDTYCEEIFVIEPYGCEAFFHYEIDPVSPGTVYFMDLSAGFPDTWLWDFGDGNFSTLPEVEHNYNAPGQYNVTLTISNQMLGCEDTYSEVIVIDSAQPCQANFIYFPVVNELTTFQFLDLSIGDIETWQWDFGDGNQSFEQNPIHEFADPGIYEVCLTVIDISGECVSVFCDMVNANGSGSGCVADFSFVQDSVDYKKFQFLDASTGDVDEWYWDFGDGSGSDLQNPVHTFPSDGPYQVTLSISSGNGNCMDQIYKYVVVIEESACTADFDYSINPTNPFLVEFLDSSQGEIEFWYWDLGDGFVTFEQDFEYEYAEAGLYTVTLITEDNTGACLSMKTTDIFISQGNACDAFFTHYQTPGDPSTVIFEDLSTGEIDEWLWDFGDGTTSGEQFPEHTYEGPGIYTVCLTISDSLGLCYDIYCVDVEVFQMDCYADFNFESSQGDPFTIQFSDQSTPGIDLYFWVFGDGTSSDEQNPVHTYQDEGDYEVCLGVFDLETSCFDSICKTVTIQLQAECEAAFAYDQDPENPFSVNFMDESTGEIVSWSWNFGDGSTSDEPSPTHLFSEEGLFEVCLEVVDITGTCTSSYCEEILVEAPEYCTADFNFEVVPDEILTVSFTDLSAGPVNAWAWDFGDGNTSSEQNPVHVFADTGLYTVQLLVYNSDSLSFCSDSIVKQVQVYVAMPECAANFIMHPDSGVNKPLLYHFHDVSENQPDEWLWDFGDGNTSTTQNPVHQYENPGEYEISLTVTKINPWGEDCMDTKSANMQTPDYFHIGGFIYTGNFPINNPDPTGDTAIVYLYRYHDDNNVMSMDTSEVTELGYFHSLFLLEDHYLIKVRLTNGSANAPYFFPTYFGDKKRWQHTPPFFLTDTSHYDVNVHLEEIPDSEGGVGAISGAVSHHSNTDAQIPAHDSQILVFNSNDQAVAYAYSNENGEFTFENLAFDTYTLYAESTGLFTEPVTITLSETNPTAFDVQLELFETDITSVHDFTTPDTQKLEIFPNPASDRIFVKTDLSGDLRITVKDLAGREILAINRQQANGQTAVDVSELTRGIYFLQVSSKQSGFSEAVKFVKVAP